MEENDRLKQRTAYLSIISNSFLVLMKLFIGLYIGAVSLISEALHSGVDLLAALIAWLAVRKSVEPPDVEHDYGHGKFENLSAAVEALLIVAAAVAIVHEAVEGFVAGGAVPENLGYGVVIMLISIIINLLVSQRLLTVAKLTHSQALEADGLQMIRPGRQSPS
jgi:cation diffusion facilitator family transporter